MVIWDADVGQYGACRLSRARRDTILAAATPGDLTAQIQQAERAGQAERAARTRARATPR